MSPSFRFAVAASVLLVASCGRIGYAPLAGDAGVPPGDAGGVQPDGGVSPDGSVSPDGGVSPDGSVSPDGGVSPDGSVSPDGGVSPGVVPPTLIGMVAGRSAHDAIVWTGTDFVVGLLSGPGLHPTLETFAPGAATPSSTQTLIATDAPRESLTLASRGGVVAVGWTEQDASGVWSFDWQLAAPAPSAIQTAASGIIDELDHDDAELVWTSAGLWVGYRASDGAGGQQMSAAFLGADGTSAPGAPVVVEASASLGDFTSVETSDGAIIVTGGSAIDHVTGTTWQSTVLSTFGSGQEGTAVQMQSGALLGTYTLARSMMTSLTLTPLPGGGYSVGPSATLETNAVDPMLGRDPSVADAVLAWVQYDDSTRVTRHVVIASIDASGAFGSSRCDLPETRAYPNDPDIVCGGGLCGMAWIEGDDICATSFDVRFAQFPAGDPAALCTP